MVNWFDFIQTIGIITGFALTSWELRGSNKLRNFEIFWRIGESHRDMWKLALENDCLRRCLGSDEVVLEKKPITVEERTFVNLLLIHIENVFQAQQQGYYQIDERGMKDLKDFFSQPFIAGVWKEVRRYQPMDFVKFVENL